MKNQTIQNHIVKSPNFSPRHFQLTRFYCTYTIHNALLSIISTHTEFPFQQICSYFYVYWTMHRRNSWRTKDQLDVTCYFISLLMCSTCFRHSYTHHQELATILLDYHVGNFVLGSLRVGDLVRLGLSSVRTLLRPSRTKSPTHNEPRTKQPMW